MTKIFDDACDKNVSCVIVYANSSNKIFYDAAFTKEVPAADCVNLFHKGVVALKGTSYYKAVSCTTAGVINFGFSA